MAMKWLAPTLAGVLVGSFLCTAWIAESKAQSTAQGPWINAPVTATQTGSSTGWKAKQSTSGAIPAQATVPTPWPAPAQQPTPSSSTTSASPPPGFWAPATPTMRVAQQPMPTPTPSRAVAPPEPAPGAATPQTMAPSAAPEAPVPSPKGPTPPARALPSAQPAGPEVIPPGQPSRMYPAEEAPMDYPGGSALNGSCWGDCEEGACDTPCFGPWWGPGAYWGYPLFYNLFRDLTLFAGAHGFKGPVDGGQNGNFGLHEGVNYSGPLGDPWGGGFQIGFQAAHSNFRGYSRRIYDGSIGGTPVTETPLDLPSDGVQSNSYIVTNGDRDQLFFTAGLFRRAPMGGLQWGVVFDLMHDAYYYTSDVKQIRTELSLVWSGWREIGFWGAFGVGDDRVTEEFTYRPKGTQQDIAINLDYTLEPTDQFNFFYRQYFRNGGEGRLWCGFTNKSDILFGGDLWIPLSDHFVLENSFNILFPKETGEETEREHAWSVMIQLVWYPGRSAKASQSNLFRPVFGVADNSTFLVDRKTNPLGQ